MTTNNLRRATESATKPSMVRGSWFESSKADAKFIVTIAIPTFNRSSWLEQCVLAALAQTYPHFEVLVSDNASTDGTAALLERLAHPRLRVLRQPQNIGAVPNWNACLAAAKGDYIVFVSDDDRIAPWLLERCMTLVRKEPDIPVVVALSDIYSVALKRRLPAIASRRLTTGLWEGSDILEEFLQRHISVVMCTILARTDALRTGGGFPLDWPHAGDMARWIPLLLGGRAGLVNERCGTYCVHESTQSSGFSLDVRLKDLRKLTNLIISLADECIQLPGQRRTIKSQANHYFALSAASALAAGRSRGEVALPELWAALKRWRHDLYHVGPTDVLPLARLLMLSVLPRSVISCLRGVNRLVYKIKPAAADEQDGYQMLPREKALHRTPL